MAYEESDPSMSRIKRGNHLVVKSMVENEGGEKRSRTLLASIDNGGEAA